MTNILAEYGYRHIEAAESRLEKAGFVTASQFDRVTFTTRGLGKDYHAENMGLGKLTQTAQTFLNEKVAEWLTGQCVGNFTSKQTDWGIENEPFAVAAYESRNGTTQKGTVQKGITYAGFQIDLVAGTCDRLVGGYGIVELKCPYNSGEHVANIVYDKGCTDYKDQLNGYLLLYGEEREWIEFVSYDPRAAGTQHEYHSKRLYRDGTELYELARRLYVFEQMLKERLLMLSIDWKSKLTTT